ncbi:MAG: 4Fe-4S binding protein [Firmicutes bacterium]|nr:4Fe-4S binding protein [Bacillota bacterium]
MQKQPDGRTPELKKCRVLGPMASIFTSANTGSFRIERPVVDYDKCIKCGICARNCPGNIIEIKKEQKECVEIDYYYCKGCGICANECPQKAIAMVRERGEH